MNNFINGTQSYYRIDNIGFLEGTSYGSSTTHTLNRIAFQSHVEEFRYYRT